MGNWYESKTRNQLLPFRPSDQPNEVQLDIARLLTPGTRFFLSVETRDTTVTAYTGTLPSINLHVVSGQDVKRLLLRERFTAGPVHHSFLQ